MSRSWFSSIDGDVTVIETSSVESALQDDDEVGGAKQCIGRSFMLPGEVAIFKNSFSVDSI